MTAPVEVWFEFASTYSYPAVMRVEREAAARGVPVIWRPFLLGPVFAAQGLTDSPFNLNPVKGAYMWRDLERVCTAQGLPFRRPSRFPRGSLLATRIAFAYADAPWVGDFIRAVFQASFGEDVEIGQSEVIGAILAGLGQDAETVFARAAEPAVKSGLRAQTEAALGHGIFGAPSFRVGDELFWGNDRLDAAMDWAVRSP
ncbi:MAG: 2-hydroxychromene-2-carboxylate isomerase [Pseudomonadota bacterium]